MSSAYLSQRIEERASLADAATAVLDRVADENRDPSDAESKQLEAWDARCKTLDGEIASLEARLKGNAAFKTVIGRVAEADDKAERRAAKPEAPARPKSFGARFIDSDAFKNYKGRGTMEPVEFAGFLERRAAIETGDLDIPAHQWDGPRGYVTTTPLLNVIGREVVSSGTVEYITWGGADPAAQVVPEGDLKPEAPMAPDSHALSLDTYAHWKAITRQALEDWPRIQSIVEGKLRGGLANALEAAAADVIEAAAWAAVTGADFVTGIRLGLGAVQAAGYQANAVLMNPTDYATLDVEASASANNGPQSFGSFWGLPIIPVGALAAGTAYVGNFDEAVTWFDRNTASVYMTDSHADYFIRNLLVVLAEQRSAFAATELQAAVKVTVTPAVPEALAASKAAAK
jgi:HK97 family phage major capsid protein